MELLISWERDEREVSHTLKTVAASAPVPFSSFYLWKSIEIIHHQISTVLSVSRSK